MEFGDRTNVNLVKLAFTLFIFIKKYFALLKKRFFYVFTNNIFSFLAFCIGTLTGRWCGKKGSPYASTLLIISTLIITLLALFEIAYSQSPLLLILGKWIYLDSIMLYWGLYYDSLTLIFLIVVLGISVCVHIYSISYMENDPHLSRFVSLLSLFTFFMIVLVTGPSLIQIFVGWEGIGVVSYLLVNFWYTRASANRAAMMALLTNRVGDWGYTLALLICISTIGSIDLSTLLGLGAVINEKLLTIFCMLLCIGVMGKSAQIGLHIWLPHAMEGPTPVSALLHAATLVTAGVFLLLRISLLLNWTPFTLTFLTVLGGMSAFLGGSLGLVANDMKRVIAYSTLSQLGYMVYAIGLSFYTISLFHLVNHAFFKALLFLSAGSIIHALKDEQDLRKMGGLKKIAAFTYIMMAIGSISLMGIPFTSGFYSKESILALGYSNYGISAGLGYTFCLIAAGSTTIYSIRLLACGFLVYGSSSKKNIQMAHEPSLAMKAPLGILAIFSLGLGFLGSVMFAPYSTFLNKSIAHKHYLCNSIGNNIGNNGSLENYGLLKYEYWGGTGYPLMLTLIGIIFALIFYIACPKILWYLLTSRVFIKIYNLLSAKYYFDHLFSILFTKCSLMLGSLLNKCLDKGIGEFIGPTGLYKSLHNGFLSFALMVRYNESPIFYGVLLLLSVGFSFCIIFV